MVSLARGWAGLPGAKDRPRYKPGTCQVRDGAGNQACRSRNQVTVRPPRRLQPHLAARLATSSSPRPPSASAPAGRSRGTPRPPQSATSTQTSPSRAFTATVIVPPGRPETLCSALLLKSSPAGPRRLRRGAPGRVPRPRRRGRPAPAPLAPPASRSPEPPPRPPRHPFPAARPGKTAPGGDGHRGMHARLSGECQAGTRPGGPCPWKPTVQHTAPTGPTWSAICPWTPQHAGLQRYTVTHGGTTQNGPPSRDFPASGPFPQVVAGDGFEPS